jgi:sugar lactone lactonase YvrE
MKQDRMEQVATTILSERHCHLGEGCTYDPATDTAWWFDILERTLFQADLASGTVTSHARAADPHHGGTFILEVGARGRPEPRVRIGST